MLASQGAKVVVNDLGAARDGTGADTGPAQEVVQEIEGMGGEAIANGDDVSDWEGAQRMVNQAIETFGDLARGRQQRRDPPRPDARQHDRGRVGLRHPGAHEGHVRAGPLGRPPTGGRRRRPASRSTPGSSTPRRCRASTATRDRRTTAPRRPPSRLHDHRRTRARPATASPSTPSPRCAHPHDRGPRHGSGAGGGAGHDGSPLDRPDLHVARGPESKGVTGRVFEASGRVLGMAETWVRGHGHARDPGGRSDPDRRRRPGAARARD